MPDTRGLAIQVIALRVLGDKVAARASEVKQALQAALIPGDRTTAALDDGTVVGSITYTKGRKGARVVDERRLADWVADHYPDEVVPTVRPAFLSAILKASVGAGVPMCPDGNADVPGIELTTGDPYLSAKPDEAQIPALVDAIRANTLLALEGDV